MAALDRQLVRDSGLSLTDYELLVALSEAPGGRMRMSALADAVVTTRSGATRAIARLVDAGLVRRVECPEDKRGTLAELTDEGAAMAAEPETVRTSHPRRSRRGPANQKEEHQS